MDRKLEAIITKYLEDKGYIVRSVYFSDPLPDTKVIEQVLTISIRAQKHGK